MNNRIAPDRADAIDRDVLNALLALGSATMQRALLAQLMADFKRIAVALQSDNSSTVDRAAHELKGLSATVGAQRLATLAQVFDAAAATLGTRARLDYRTEMCAEIDAVLLELDVALQRAGEA